MANTKNNPEILDLHWRDEDPDFGILSDGVWCKDTQDIIRRITEVKNTVKIINLNNQYSLKEIPLILGECKRLEEIDLSFTPINDVPEFLFTLPSLRSFTCCCWELSWSPLGLSKAEKLEKLHMRLHQNWDFPKEITALHELKYLTLDLYGAITLPDELSKLSKLEELTLSIHYDEGVIPKLPESIKGHQALKKISICDFSNKKNKTYDLEIMTQTLSSCPNLEFLKLSGFNVNDGHRGLSLLKGLKDLELRYLQVTGNPFDSIAALVKLQKLEIWGNDFNITEIPDIFSGFQELQIFLFTGSIIHALPPSFYNLVNLVDMEIGSAGLVSLDRKIGNLQKLKKIHLHNNVLEALPDTIFTLPALSVLNIEDNNFRPNDIAAIREKITEINKKSPNKKIEFTAEGQGRGIRIKKLRSIRENTVIDPLAYYRFCVDAVNDDSAAFKYVDKNRLKTGRYYDGLCKAVVRKSCFALEEIDTQLLDKGSYFIICQEAAKNSGIGHAFKSIKDELLTEYEYIRICLEAAIHNNSTHFLPRINTKRFSREIYERICWVAVMNNPLTIKHMFEPTEELYRLSELLRTKRKAK
ncbi:MAG: hypothetical protein LBH16_04355 [Treponema sp.]|jgi:Leucine-rich repeat (LRR) protein|nr:hypothetical protein [Treponema sp.]